MSGRVASGRPRLLATLAVCLSTSLSAQASFSPGQVLWAAGDCSSVCQVFDVTAGGDFTGAAAFATIQRSPGQVAWKADLTTAYVTEFADDRVSSISSTGVVTTFATGILQPTGLLRVSDGRLLVASFADGAIYDISGGGDFSLASPFAFNLSGPRNLIELDTGEILVADQNLNAVFDIAAGGDRSNTPTYAFGLPLDGPFDLVQDASGNLYASTFQGVLDITGGGDVSGDPPFAYGRDLIGLTIGPGGEILASEFDLGNIFDISAGGDVSGASPWASNLDGFGDTSLDTVPAAATPPAVPAVGGPPGAALLGLLGSILVYSGRALRTSA